MTDQSSGYSQVLKATNGTDTVYYSRGFELISRREGDATSYYLYDGGLSVRALTDTTGAVTDTLVFDAFGNETEKTGTTANTYGFQGEEHDATGLYYLRARYMDPVSGTFTSMDTYAESLSDPISLHKYLFANSNPVMYSDPSGNYTLTEQETAIAIQAIIGEATSGIFYIADMLITDSQMKNHSVGGLIFTMLMGFLLGACGGFAKVSASAWAFKMILGAFGISFGTLGLLKGYDDYKNGHSVYGIFEIILSVTMISRGISGVRAGWSEKGEYSGFQGFNKTPEDIYSFGSKSGPRGARPQQDFGVNDSNSTVGPEKNSLPKGASNVNNPDNAPLSGPYHRLPKGTALPKGLGIKADGSDVNPNSPHVPGHYTIYPSRKMTVEQFNKLYKGLPWQYGGKKTLWMFTKKCLLVN